MRSTGCSDMVNMTNKTHKSRAKRYFLVESREALRALKKFRQRTSSKERTQIDGC